jgi:hypothetical protein
MIRLARPLSRRSKMHSARVRDGKIAGTSCPRQAMDGAPHTGTRTVARTNPRPVPLVQADTRFHSRVFV